MNLNFQEMEILKKETKKMAIAVTSAHRAEEH